MQTVLPQKMLDSWWHSLLAALFINESSLLPWSSVAFQIFVGLSVFEVSVLLLSYYPYLFARLLATYGTFLLFLSQRNCSEYVTYKISFLKSFAFTRICMS